MSALAKFSKLSARNYLQSVVFVDDHIFDQKTGMPTLPVDALPQRKRIFRTADITRADAKVSPPSDGDENTEQPYHPKDLVSSFARQGITCALYEPKEGFSTAPDSEIFKLCERPDIIILDWDFSGDKGMKALDLIAALVKQGSQEFPHHTRLISVYTDDPSLVGVANQIADRLKKDDLDATPEDAQCRIRSGASRLVVLGKPRERFGEEEQNFTVKESGLADKLIDEFVGMNSGILPSYALHGLAAIRRNSKRILDRFHGDLDGAFLLHRELVSASEEAFDQLPELLADEIRAVVAEQGLSPKRAKSIVLAANKGNTLSGEDKELIALSDHGKGAKQVAKKLRNACLIPVGHLRLAALFSSQTQYSSSSRRLCFGTIVRFKDKHSRKPWEYAMCLVPECDGLRLKENKPVRFPFWTVETKKHAGDCRRKGMVLPVTENTHIVLSASGKLGDKLWTDSFMPDMGTGTVIACRARRVYKFRGSERTVEWVGQLKPLHAHRIVREITDEMSRVGVSEAEWFRLLLRTEH